MNTKLTLLATVASLVVAAPAFAGDSIRYKAQTEVKKEEDGSYTKTTSEKRSGPSGTTRTSTETEVEVNEDGSVDKSVETKSSNDPDGLFNKKTIKTKDSIKHEDDKTVIKHKKTVDGDTVEDTEREIRR